jgi:hypothetical protein
VLTPTPSQPYITVTVLYTLNLYRYIVYLAGTLHNGKTNQQLITAALMENYDRITRPVLNMSDSTTVILNPRLMNIIDVVSYFLIIFTITILFLQKEPNMKTKVKVRFHSKFHETITCASLLLVL